VLHQNPKMTIGQLLKTEPHLTSSTLPLKDAKVDVQSEFAQFKI
jgi:hypothetical protein